MIRRHGDAPHSSPYPLIAIARPSIMIDIEDLRQQFPGCSTFTFGDSEKMCDRLLALVRIGKKRATCAAIRGYESEDEPLPIVGRVDIALNWDRSPALAIETTDVAFVRFRHVNESFALAEGEDESLEQWQESHRTFIDRNGGFETDLLLVCQRFKLVVDYAAE